MDEYDGLEKRSSGVHRKRPDAKRVRIDGDTRDFGFSQYRAEPCGCSGVADVGNEGKVKISTSWTSEKNMRKYPKFTSRMHLVSYKVSGCLVQY